MKGKTNENSLIEFDYTIRSFSERCKQLHEEDFVQEYINHKLPKHIGLDQLGYTHDTDKNKIFYKDILGNYGYTKYAYFDQFMVRNVCQITQGFVVLDEELIDDMKDIIGNGKVLEVMCGLGSIGTCLRNVGIDVKLTDNFSWANKFNYENAWADDIELLDAVKAVYKYGKNMDYILMSWPPYGENTAELVYKAMKEVNPKCKLIYIGEGYDGCCATDSFFDLWQDGSYEPFPIKSWEGIHDDMYILS